MFDIAITGLIVTQQFDYYRDKFAPGSFYLVYNAIFFAIAQNFLVQALFLVMIVKFQRPSRESVRLSMDQRYVD